MENHDEKPRNNDNVMHKIKEYCSNLMNKP